MRKVAFAIVGVAAVAGGYYYYEGGFTHKSSSSAQPESPAYQPQQTSSFLNTVPEISTNLDDFVNYLAKYGKSYETKEEFLFRAQLFEKTKREVMVSQAQNGVTYRLGLNQFSDWTDEEFNQLLGNRQLIGTDEIDTAHLKELDTTNLPVSVDWRAQGKVNPVKNQGKCGSCWSFSATGGVESRFAIEHGQLLTLSEQQLVDCAQKEGNNGCNGGLATQAYEYIRLNGQQSNASYPYTALDGPKCLRNQSDIQVYVSEWVSVKTQSPDQLKAALATGPVSVSVDAGGVFRNYQNGILNAGCGTSLNHAILAVGYGVEKGQEYYIVRNSWGPSWGEGGYIRLAIVNGTGTCGVQIRPSYAHTQKA